MFLASAIENSVRRTLQNGNALDPDYRVLVYEAAERAILRGEAAGSVSEHESDARRRDLIAAIESIELEYPPADRDSLAEDDPAEVLGDPRAAESASSAAVARYARGDTSSGRPAPEAKQWSPGARRPIVAPSRRLTRGIVATVISVLVLFLLGALAYLVLPFFFTRPFAIAPTPVIDPVAQAIRDAGNPEMTSDGWVPVFSGDNLDAIAAGSRQFASMTTAAGGRAAVAIKAPAAQGAATKTLVPFIVPGGVVARLSGRRVRSELTVGSPDGKPRTFAVECQFAGKSVCGRQRFSTTVASQTFVFDMDMSAKTGTGSSAEARVEIDPGILDDGRDLYVYGLRFRGT